MWSIGSCGISHGKMPKLQKRTEQTQENMEIQQIHSPSLLMRQLWYRLQRILQGWKTQLHPEKGKESRRQIRQGPFQRLTKKRLFFFSLK